MKTTPQEIKRKEISKIFKETLKETQTYLSPLSISVCESFESDFTSSEFSFTQSMETSDTVLVKERGKGLVDCLFLGLQKKYSPQYRSLDKVKMLNFEVNPSWSSSLRHSATDAKASVSISVEVGNRGISSFRHQSRSVIYSTFAASLKAFQFYINCDRSFSKIQLILKDAAARNRYDIIEGWKYRLSKLTEVNNYEKEEKS